MQVATPIALAPHHQVHHVGFIEKLLVYFCLSEVLHNLILFVSRLHLHP